MYNECHDVFWCVCACLCVCQEDQAMVVQAQNLKQQIKAQTLATMCCKDTCGCVVPLEGTHPCECARTPCVCRVCGCGRRGCRIVGAMEITTHPCTRKLRRSRMRISIRSQDASTKVSFHPLRDRVRADSIWNLKTLT